MFNKLKRFLLQIPIFNKIANKIAIVKQTMRFKGSSQYWEKRYNEGGNSGDGSYGKNAELKAKIINEFVEENDIKSVIELGCGDGNQLKKLNVQNYLGFDISSVAIAQCKDIFKDDSSKSFKLMEEYSGETAELSISLDVIFHLVEDSVFESYMEKMFTASTRFVFFYSTNTNKQRNQQYPHMKHRQFTEWIEKHVKGWSLKSHIPSTQFPTEDLSTPIQADFFIYQKIF